MKEKTRVARIKKNWETQLDKLPTQKTSELAEIIDFLKNQTDAFCLKYKNYDGLNMVVAIQGRNVREWNQK